MRTVRLVAVLLLSLVLLGWLTGCATVPAAPLTRTVTVSVPCVRSTDIPTRPELLSEEAWKNPSAFERAKALKIDRLRLISHADKLEAVLHACAG